MTLTEFYNLAAKRAQELGSKYWAVEVNITTSETSGSVAVTYLCYMPEAAHGFQSSETAAGALRKIGALPPLEIEDDSDPSIIERDGTG